MTTSHIVIIPSFNTGPILRQTVQEARQAWNSVLVVVDGSTDGSDVALDGCVLRRSVNGGKGLAVQDGLRCAAASGYSHALIMDADGQHPAESIVAMMEASAANPGAMILGQPAFGAEAPWARVHGRRVGNMLTRLLTRGADLGDSLFGFRVYPIGPLLSVMAGTYGMRGYDFDTEAIIRLSWRGVPGVTRLVPVRYLRPEDGGVSHFRYGRDNLRLAWMYARLLPPWLARLTRSRRGSKGATK